MLGFYDRLREKKDAYLNYISTEARKFKYVVIYGAGRVAKPIVHKLQEEKVSIECFAVSDTRINNKVFFEIPVMKIDEIKLELKETLIIIAVKYIWAKDVLDKIIESGYEHYIFPPEEIDYFAREQSDEVHRPVMEISLKAGCKVN